MARIWNRQTLKEPEHRNHRKVHSLLVEEVSGFLTDSQLVGCNDGSGPS